MASITVDLLLKTGTFSADSDRAAKALEQLGKSAAKVSAGIDKQVSSLQFQADTFGKSTRETTLYELALKGASAQQLKSAESALAQVEAQEKLATAGKLAVAAVVAIGAAAITAAVAIDKLINYAGSFQDLSDETGASAVDLASLAVAAGQAGVSMESVASATTKLTKNLVGVDDESKAAGAALSALNINIADFKKLDPVAQYEAVSKALSGFADGAQKTAVAQALFGKSGAEQLKVLKALEDQGGRTNILTAQQIALADDFSDRQAKNAATLKLYAAAVATQFIEPTNALIKVAQDAIIQLTGLGNATTALGVNEGVQHFAEGAGRELAKVADYIKTTIGEFKALTGFVEAFGKISGQLLTGDVAGARKTGADFRTEFGLDKYGRGGTAAGETFVQAYDKALAGAKRTTFAQTDPRRLDLGKDGRPVDSRAALNFNGAVKPIKGITDDPTKKLLDNQLKLIGDAIKEQQDLLGAQQKTLGVFYDQGLNSTADYYDKQRKIIQDATQTQSDEYDQQVALLKKFQANTPKEKDKATAQGQINDILEKQSKLQQDAGQKFVDLSFAQQAATKRLAQEYQGVNAQVLELQGNLSEAAAIKFDQSFDKLKTTFTTEGNEQGLKYIEILRSAAISQAELNNLSKQFSLIQGDLSIAEDRIAIKQQTSGLGELDALKQVGEARKGAIVQLQAQIDAFDKLDIASKTPEQIQAIERLRLELEKLQATVDPLALKINGVFEDSFSNSFTDFITGAKSARQAMQDFGKSVFKELASLSSKDIAKSIFGGDGGIGGFASGLFKQGGASGSSAASSPLADIGSAIKSGFSNLFGGSSLVGSNQKAGEGINVAASGFNAARDGLVPTAGSAGSPITAANTPTIDTSAISTSFTTLQTTGIDPTTAALSRLQQAVDSAAGSVSRLPGGAAPIGDVGSSGSGLTTGDFTRTDHNSTPVSGTTGEQSITNLFKSTSDASSSTDTFGKTAASAASEIVGFAGAVGKSSSALSLLPSIITAISTASAVSSTSSNSSLFGSLAKLFGGGSSYGGSDAAVSSGASLTANGFAGYYDGGYVSNPFDDGGYTGDKGIKQAAGVVHGKEFVFSAKAVQTLGVGYLEHVHDLAKAGKVEGYESGGYVGTRSIQPYNAGVKYKEPDRPSGRDPRTYERPLTINITQQPGMTRESGSQIGAAIFQRLRGADARNN